MTSGVLDSWFGSTREVQGFEGPIWVVKLGDAADAWVG